MKSNLLLSLIIISILLSQAITVNAEQSWLTTYEETHNEMQEKVIHKIKKNWIADKPDADSDISEFDVNEAYEVYNITSDMFMIQNYYKADSVDGIINAKSIYDDDKEQPHYWAVPAATPSGKYSEILLNITDKGYSVSDCIVYGDETNTYEILTYSIIKEKINEYFEDNKIVKVCVLICSNYKMSLIYLKTSDDKEYFIPYESLFSNTLKTMKYKEGELYEASDFINKMDSCFTEYDSVSEYIDSISTDPDSVLATGLMTTRDPYDPNSDNTLKVLSITCIIILVCAIGLFVFKKIRKNK